MNDVVPVVAVVLFVSVMVILPITRIADASRRPKSQFERAGQNKTAWIAMMATFVVVWAAWLRVGWALLGQRSSEAGPRGFVGF